MTEREHSPPELWNINQIADYLGIKSSSARGNLTRWGIKAHTYQRGNGPARALYLADQIRHHRPAFAA